MGLKSKISSISPKGARIFVPWAIRHPRYIRSFSRILKSHKKCVQLREDAKQNGIVVPPFMILSITKKCNLKCAGCYAAAVGTVNNNIKKQLDIEDWKKIIRESNDMGVLAYVIAGGEPFMYPGLLELPEEFKDRLFLIFTNGTAIKEHHIKKLKKLTNVAIMVSVEGGKEETDQRRGEGVYERTMGTLKTLKKAGVICGISATITQLNYEYWMKPEHLDDLIKQKVKIGFFLEYIPSKPGIESLIMLNKYQRKQFRAKVLDYRKNKKMILLHSPGDEELLGGCVSAGRGFAHVTPTGDLTPCPVSNIATHNLKKSTMKEGLSSQLFQLIRENEHLLETEGTPCALYAHQEEVAKLAKSVGAYKTN